MALIAGAEPTAALRLAVAMTMLQASIGSLNDLVDAPRDIGRTPAKPIPGGLVARPAAWLVVAVTAALGVSLSLPSGPPTTALALVVLGIGYAYDLWFKGTAWSWVPFAVGIPILPVYAWLGATGGLPSAFAVLLPAGVLAGAGLAISNALADMERDATAGADSVATRLGAGRAWAVQAILLVTVIAAAWLTLAVGPDNQAAVGGPAGRVGALVATVVIGAGIVIGRRGDPARRERAWELEAIGVGLLAAAWLSGVPLGGQG